MLFTYTQFFMNYIPQLLHASYGYDHGQVASLSASPLCLRASRCLSERELPVSPSPCVWI